MDALIPNQVPESSFQLLYQQRDITHDISKDLLSLTYTDHLTGQSDDLQVNLMDPEGKWRGSRYPGHGDTLDLSIGWRGKPPRPIGRFEIDEVEAASPPFTIGIHALGAGINLPMRTPEHRAYESTTLAEVARQVARRLGLVLIGKIAPIRIDRLTQQEDDLAFLNTLAGEYDYAFKITGRRLVFHAISDLAAAAPVATFALSDLASFRFRDQIRVVPKAIQVKHRDPAEKQLVTYHIANGETVAVPSSSSKATSSADTAKQRRRSVSTEVAEARAKAEQARANRERTTAQLTLMGRPNLVSGNVIALTSAGTLGGRYLITQACHRFSRVTGYTVELSVCRVQAPAIEFDSPRLLGLSTYGIQSQGELA